MFFWSFCKVVPSVCVIAVTIFLALNDATFCNSFLRFSPSSDPLVSLNGYLRFWGIVLFVVTILVAFFVNEKDKNTSYVSIKTAYRQLWEILRLPRMCIFSLFLKSLQSLFPSYIVNIFQHFRCSNLEFDSSGFYVQSHAMFPVNVRFSN